MTYAQLESRANRLACAYANLGVRQGDFVSICLPNGIEFVERCYAIWKLRAAPEPVSFRLPAPELRGVLDLAAPALVVGLSSAGKGNGTSVPPGYQPDPTLADTSRISPAWKQRPPAEAPGNRN
ncbi:AMP-binding protein [Nocardia sp. NPDC057030]|uniref:AMP-binding protein n=1 Tax=unclassified Nocardia TaxID=2637762 RepID=UPI00363279E1